MPLPSAFDFAPSSFAQREENPLSIRLNNIRDLQIRIDRCRQNFLEGQQKFQDRLQELSAQIRMPVYIPWMGKQVQLKQAMQLIKERYAALTKRPMVSGDVDRKAEEVCRLRDEVLKPISKLNETYEELDRYEEEQRAEMEIFLRERESLIEEYILFSFQNKMKLRKKISTEAHIEIQLKYAIYVTPYIGNAKKRIENNARREIIANINEITKHLSFCLYGLYEIKEWCDKLLELETRKPKVAEGQGGLAFRRMLEPIRSAIVKKDDRSKILATIQQLESANNSEQILMMVAHKMSKIYDLYGEFALTSEGSIAELFQYVKHLINSIEKCRKEIKDARKVANGAILE